MEPFLVPDPPVETLEAWLTVGGGEGLAAARQLGAAATIDEIDASGLRGRGGGGFPTGAKWQSVAGGTGTEKYVVANGAEGEPGSFKDRAIMAANPYQVIEGLAIAAFAIGAREAFLAIKATFVPQRDALRRALAEMQETGLAGDVPITLVEGPEDYLFGEEKALLEVIEGRDALPRLLPPYLHGLFATAPQMGWSATDLRAGHAGRHESNPTLVNNVETLANVGPILRRGPGWFRTMGTAASPGSIVATVVGDVVDPGVVEVEMGTPLDVLIDHGAGGPHPGRQVKAVFSGVANPVIVAAQLGTRLTYEHMSAIRSGLGSAGFIVFDDTACMVEVARLMSNFLAVESCGQCRPCKAGSTEITDRLFRIEGGAGTDDDIATIGSWLRQVTDGARCYLATEEQELVSSLLRCFPEEFAAHLDDAACPLPRDIPFPPILRQ